MQVRVRIEDKCILIFLHSTIEPINVTNAAVCVCAISAHRVSASYKIKQDDAVVAANNAKLMAEKVLALLKTGTPRLFSFPVRFEVDMR